MVVNEVVEKLFASGEDDLIEMGVVGMAQPIEIIKNAMSRMVEVKDGMSKLREIKEGEKRFILSGIAMGIVMKVYPQMANRPGNIDLNKVIKLLKKVFETETLCLRPNQSQTQPASNEFINKYLCEELKRCCPQAPDTWN